MKKSLFVILTVLLLLGSRNFSMAQRQIISGRLVDVETEEPLSYASVGIKGETYGTITNSLGLFDLHVKGDVNGKILAVSMLGFENFEMVIGPSAFETTLTIRLKRIPQVLEEITISDSLTGADIVDIAINRLPFNYANESYLLDGFYRDIKRVNNTYISLLESAIQIYDHNHDQPRNPFKLREKVGLVQVRKSLGYNHRYTGYFDQGNLLENLLLNNNVRYYDFPATGLSDVYERLGRSKLGNKDVYIIRSRHKGIKMMIYIDVITYAILRLEYESDYDENILNVNERYREYLNRQVKVTKTIEYQLLGDKYYLHYMTMYKRNQWYHKDNKTLDYDVELFQELLVNDIHPKTNKRIKSDQRMRKYGLQYQDQPYDKEFWENYNVIKRTPLDERIIEDLEREGNLEQQFHGNTP